MDRFIAKTGNCAVDVNMTFKIQYGQIYSVAGYEKEYLIKNLKSNMDRFIGQGSGIT